MNYAHSSDLHGVWGRFKSYSGAVLGQFQSSFVEVCSSPDMAKISELVAEPDYSSQSYQWKML